MRSVSLGHVADIDVRLHPSLALVIVWVLFDWNRLAPASVGAMTWGLAIVCIVFGSVLLHEFGHAFMARHHRIGVRDITLSALGGVARMERLSAAPRVEASVALAGPIVNVAIAGLLIPWALFLGAVAGHDSPEAYLRALVTPSPVGLILGVAVANLLIAAFNMMPAFPMDGGRLLRASLAAAIGHDRATRAVVLGAQVLALVMAGVGIMWFGSVVVPIIALFIAASAHLEGRLARVEGALRRLRVGQFALWDHGGIAPDRPLTWALRWGPRDIAVTDGGRVVGMLWRSRLLAEIGAGAGDRLVGEVVDRSAPVIAADASVYDAHRVMTDFDCWAIPIVDGATYRGVVTIERLTHVYNQISPQGRLPRPLAAFDRVLHGLLRAVAR
jgi:Zn-dependent protease